MQKHTEKTIKKNGRKWSNISVKKYHHTPVFGAKSGSVSLSSMLRWHHQRGNDVGAYVAPQVCGIHSQLPATKVETSVRAPKYSKSSLEKSRVFRRLFDIGWGEARWENGSVASRSRIGKSTTAEDSDKCIKNDRANRVADVFPVYEGLLSQECVSL